MMNGFQEIHYDGLQMPLHHSPVMLQLKISLITRLYVTAFNSYFSTIGETLAKNFANDDKYKIYLKEQYNENMFLTPTMEHELLKVIEKLPLHKAPGLDGINSNLVKCTSRLIVQPLVHIYNLSFMTADVPNKLPYIHISSW